MEGVQWSDQPVRTGIEVFLNRQNAYIKGCEDIIESLADTATDLGRGSDTADPQQIEQLRQAVTQLLEARHTAQLHAAALQELKGTYRAGPGVTDFQAALSQHAEAAAAAPYAPKQDPLFRNFEQAASGEGCGAEGGADEQIDDDIAIEGGAAQLAPNVRCPISNRLLLEIEEPMQDAMGVVYEKAAAEHYFRSLHPSKHGRDIIMAGSSHYVTLSELVPAEKVIREKRRQARRQKAGGRSGAGGSGHGADDGDVLDV